MSLIMILCLLLFLQFRVGKAGVVDVLELFDEDGLGVSDVTEGDGTLTEVALGHLCVDETVHEFADGLLRIVGQRAGGRLDGVGHHEDGLLLGERVRSGIGEQQFVDVVVGVGVLVLHIEELGLALTVVGGDKFADYLRQVVLLSHLDTLGDVADDHLGAVDGTHLLVGVDTRLILCEIDGIGDLADVVVEGTSAHQLTLGSDLIGNLCGEVTHLDGVLESAWGHLTHLAQQFLVHVGELDEGDVRREAEGLLQKIEQGVGAEEQDAVDDDIVVFAVVDLREAVIVDPVDGEVRQCHACGDEYGRPEEL